MKKLVIASVLALVVATPAHAASAPTLISVGHEERHPTATWKLPEYVEASIVEVATRPETASDGRFWRENVVILDFVNDTDTSWLHADRLKPGTYYVHVEGWDNSCLHNDFQTECGAAWSNTLPLTISAEDDPPRLVLNRSIGFVKLGMFRWDVEFLYGAPDQTQILRRYFPLGTRYFGFPLVRATYRLHAGTVTVEYVNDEVKTIRTTSRYYRTGRGVGVGVRTPRGRCHWQTFKVLGGDTHRQCVRRWESFSLIPGPECGGPVWVGGTRQVETYLFLNRSRRVTSVLIGDPDVILYCF